MADRFLLEIVTPTRKILSTEVDELTATGQDGDFGVLAGHTPFLTTLKPGEISFKKGGETGLFATAKGYAEVLPDKTTILTDNALSKNEINPEAARKALNDAEELLKKLTSDDAGYQEAVDASEFAQAQIRVKERG